MGGKMLWRRVVMHAIQEAVPLERDRPSFCHEGEPGLSHRVISSILRHDSKQTSYKIALLRALNDVVLAYPDLRFDGRPVAVPLRALAEAWVAYYWPFTAATAPILQGVRSRVDGRWRHDLSFRPHLTALREAWEAIYGPSGAAGGWHLTDHLRVPRKRDAYPTALRKLYGDTLQRIAVALRQPIQYAGEGRWTVFAAPRRLREVEGTVPLPGSHPGDVCVVVSADLWGAFRDVSLWVEALCIHEWSLFTERVSDDATRGEAYALLTERPDNRLPLDWERNRIDLLIDEGARFACPWTGRPLQRAAYQLDHIVPVSVYPFHELWNLVPADARFNMHQKRARLPGSEALRMAEPRLEQTYRLYGGSGELTRALIADVAVRFSRVEAVPAAVARAVTDLVESIAAARNVARF
jgi:hypothetical protein